MDKSYKIKLFLIDNINQELNLNCRKLSRCINIKPQYIQKKCKELETENLETENLETENLETEELETEELETEELETENLETENLETENLETKEPKNLENIKIDHWYYINRLKWNLLDPVIEYTDIIQVIMQLSGRDIDNIKNSFITLISEAKIRYQILVDENENDENIAQYLACGRNKFKSIIKNQTTLQEARKKIQKISILNILGILSN